MQLVPRTYRNCPDAKMNSIVLSKVVADGAGVGVFAIAITVGIFA